MKQAKNVIQRLLNCGYGYSMIPPNWWSEEQLRWTEKTCKELKKLNLTQEEWVLEFLKRKEEKEQLKDPINQESEKN